MTHGTSQPTLHAAPGTSSGDEARPLSLIDAIALLSFERATRDRAPIAPSAELAVALGTWLESRGFLTLCGDGDRRDATPPQRAIYDPIAWRYCSWMRPGPELEAQLLATTRRLSANPATTEGKLALWRELACAELEGYLAALLRRHGLDTRWAVDVRELSETWIESLPLSRLRYVIWAAIREGAATFLREAGDLEETREAIAREMRRRAAWLGARSELGVGFMPVATVRQSLLLTVFLEDVAWLGTDYWNQVPSEHAIRAHARPPGA